jgi:hypothetical protein
MYTKYKPAKKKWKQEKRSKGVGKKARDSQLTIEDYKSCLHLHKRKIVKMKSLRSFKHDIFTVTLHKHSLNALDEKRHWIDAYHGVSHGHFSIGRLLPPEATSDIP